MMRMWIPEMADTCGISANLKSVLTAHQFFKYLLYNVVVMRNQKRRSNYWLRNIKSLVYKKSVLQAERESER